MKILLVIDMQNDFLEGALRNEEGIKIIPKVVEKINEYKRNNDIVIATLDTHQTNYLDTQEGKNLPVTHCVKDTYGWQIQTDVMDALGDALLFEKPTFGSTELASYLKEKYEKIQSELEIEIVGVCTDICVISNAMVVKAFYPELPLIVDAKGCAGVTPESHKRALEAMKVCQIKVVNR